MKNATDISIKKRIALEIHSLRRGLEARTHDLRYLFWECTLRCNLHCLHCGSDCTAKNDTPDMPLMDFLAVLDKISARCNPRDIMVCLTGGEPTLRKDLAAAGTEFRRRGFRWGMVTNGMALTEGRFDELLKAGIGSMAISLDGLKADHNWFRGNSHSHEKAIQAIELAAAATQKHPAFVFDVVTCVNQRNFSSLERIKDSLITKGVRNWRLASVFPKGRAAENTEIKLTQEQMHGLMNFIAQTRAEGKIRASYGCEGFLGGFEFDVRSGPFYCRAGISIGSVLADGSISACPSLRADYIQGNIYKDDFLDIWDNRFQVMRNRNWAKTGECSKCKVWKYCHGNGLHLRDEKTGSLLFCNYRALTGQ